MKLPAFRNTSNDQVLSVAEGSAYLSAQAIGDGLSAHPYVINLDPGSEAQLIAKELEILGHDRVYDQALSFLANIA